MDGDDVAAAFEAERPRLLAVSRRLLGSTADAEDAVQEAWLRLERHGAAGIDNLAGWLTTVVGRICLDHLRAGRTRVTVPWDDVPVHADDARGPAEAAELAESVGTALLVVLEVLTPGERVALVLHDAFGMPFEEVAGVLGRTREATKKAASRARQKVHAARTAAGGGGRDGSGDLSAHRRVVDAFLAAGRSGDLAGLVAVLDPDVVLLADTPAGRVVATGAGEVAGRARAFASRSTSTTDVLVDGLCGCLARDADGSAVSLLVFRVVDERVVAVASLADPARLARLVLPSRAGR